MKNFKQFPVILFLICFCCMNHCLAQSPINLRAKDNLDPSIKVKIEEAKKSVLEQGPGFEIVGTIESGNKSTFSINGEDFSVTPETQIEGSLRVGVPAQVTGVIKSGIKYAKNINISDNASNITSTEHRPDSLIMGK